MTGAQPPVGLEIKPPAALAPGPHSTTDDTDTVLVDPPRATVTMIAVVADTVDEVGHRTVPGAFTRSLRVHTPNEGLPGHQWNVPRRSMN